MTRFRVRASGPLEGRVEVAGATKNSGVKQMAACCSPPVLSTLRNMPSVLDLDVMSDLLRAVGARARPPEPNVVRVDASGDLQPEAPYELVTRMRASFNVLGPLLARCGEARVALPGGDDIGSRKVDMHLRGLESMGAQVAVAHGFVHACGDLLHGARAAVGVPERRRHREPDVRGRARQGHDGDRERGARARGDRPRRLPRSHGRAGRRRGHVDDRDRRCRGARAGRERDHGRPGRSGNAAHGVRHRRRRDRARRDAPRAPRDRRLASCARWACACRRPPTGCGRGRPAACTRSTSRRFRTPDSRPTSCRSRSRSCRWPKAARSPPRTSTTVASSSSTSSCAWAPTCATRAGTRSCGASSGSRAPRSPPPTCGPAPRSSLAGLVADGETIVHGCEHVDRGYPDLPATLRSLGADVERIVTQAQIRPVREHLRYWGCSLEELA